MSEATISWLVLLSIAVAAALVWNMLLHSFLLATLAATTTSVFLFQVAVYLQLGYLEPFFLIAVATSSVVCFFVAVAVGMLVRSGIRGKNRAL